jgi:hypothetical protein
MQPEVVAELLNDVHIVDPGHLNPGGGVRRPVLRREVHRIDGLLVELPLGVVGHRYVHWHRRCLADEDDATGRQSNLAMRVAIGGAGVGKRAKQTREHSGPPYEEWCKRP